MGREWIEDGRGRVGRGSGGDESWGRRKRKRRGEVGGRNSGGGGRAADGRWRGRECLQVRVKRWLVLGEAANGLEPHILWEIVLNFEYFQAGGYLHTTVICEYNLREILSIMGRWQDRAVKNGNLHSEKNGRAARRRLCVG